MLKRFAAGLALAFLAAFAMVPAEAAIRLTLPQTSLPAGSGAQKTTATIPDTDNLCVVTINKVNWPGDGLPAGTFSISYYPLGSQTPVLLMRGDFYDSPADGNQIVFAASIPPVTGRKIEIEWTFLKPLTISGNLATSQVTVKP
jgi:hypothetical protein